MDGTGNSVLSMTFHGAGVLAEAVSWWRWWQGVICALNYTAGSMWASEAGGAAPRMEEK